MTLKRQRGKPVGKQKRKVNLLGPSFDAGKHAHDEYEKKHHPNRKRPKPTRNRVPMNRLPNNHQSTRGKQMRGKQMK